MTKRLECGAVVPGCDFVAHAQSDEELLMVVTDHARSAHQLERISPELRARLAKAIKEE